MRLHRFCIGDSFAPDREADVTDPQLLHQWMSVLRLKNGDQLTVLDGKGHEASATIVKIDKRACRLRSGEARDVPLATKRNVTLCCAILRRENFEWVTQKATEVGVQRIIPLLTERTVKNALNIERLERIAMEAMEQSGGGFLPVIEQPQSLADARALTEKMDRQLFFHFDGTDSWERDMRANETVVCWIGPEGGWSDAEAAWARDQNLVTAALGKSVMRAETAAVIAAYLAGR